MAAKESLELLESLSKTTDIVADKVLADGEVTLLDARYLPELVSALRPGISGVAKVKDEMASYSREELEAVISAFVDFGLKVVSKFAK